MRTPCHLYPPIHQSQPPKHLQQCQPHLLLQQPPEQQLQEPEHQLGCVDLICTQTTLLHLLSTHKGCAMACAGVQASEESEAAHPDQLHCHHEHCQKQRIP